MLLIGEYSAEFTECKVGKVGIADFLLTNDGVWIECIVLYCIISYDGVQGLGRGESYNRMKTYLGR